MSAMWMMKGTQLKIGQDVGIGLVLYKSCVISRFMVSGDEVELSELQVLLEIEFT